jgi:hypothetical protein
MAAKVASSKAFLQELKGSQLRCAPAKPRLGKSGLLMSLQYQMQKPGQRRLSVGG